ncbi:MFS general substrate transporter [Viridothelium virens]|uniref:MFS general substrate transporter n=1 Tax=Viridothelium virens TaxID=1048519 RepID=A0A6A6HAJ4_VIRVR|nr:MFS general substrate transporter [Viridothelium virens]
MSLQSTPDRANSPDSTLRSSNSEQHVVSSGKENMLEKQQKAPYGPHLTGWRFHFTIIGLMLGIFLSTMEVSIVSTALVDITNELQAFKHISWVINAYMLTYTGFLIIWAQFSHVLGRKPSVILAHVLFISFSGACAGSRTALQLIIFRAFQGIGGAGVFNMSIVILAEVTGPAKFPKYSAIASVMYILAFGLGPLIGGSISSTTTWRWVFWLNIPLACLPLLIDTIALPNGFPRHNLKGRKDPAAVFSSLRKLDLIGAGLFLALSVLFVTALQEADIDWNWNSVPSICLLTFASVSAILFVLWERFVTLHWKDVVPVLTWKFTSRKCIGMFMSFFLVSTPTTSAIVQIPERFQILDGESPFDAAIRLLPFMIAVSLIAFISSMLVSRYQIKPAYGLLVGIAIQIVGAALFCQLPNTTTIDPAEYVYEVVLGIGLGINNILLVTSVPFMVEKHLIPSALGAGMQFRYLGGTVGLGVVTAVFSSSTRPQLNSLLGASDASEVLQSAAKIHQFPQSVQGDIQRMFGHGFTLQWKVLLGFICGEVLAALMML